MEKGVVDYPSIENVPACVTPKLDEILFNAKAFTENNSLRNWDIGMQCLQKGVTTAINAVVRVASKCLEVGASNQDLDEISEHVFAGLKMLVNVHCGISAKCKDLIKSKLDGMYAKAVSRAKDGDGCMEGS